MGRPPVDLDAHPELFWNRVAKTDACWEWTGARRNTYGHGAVQFRQRADGPHRVAWVLTYGEILEGLFVCHHCDNGPCCRPDHLFLGTCKDNSRDMVSKGRATAGPPLKLECKRGHPLSGANLFPYKTTLGRPGRGCRECRREASKRWKQKARP